MSGKIPSDGMNMVHRSEMAVVPTSKEIQLPKVIVDSMTKRELKEFIPQLLKIVTGRDDVWHSRRSAKPDWWPAEVNWASSKDDWLTESYWTDNLRSVVRSCYKHMGKEELLYDPKVNVDINYNKKIEMASPVKPQSYPPSPLKLPKGVFLPFTAEVFICFFCESEFYSKEEMRAHQQTCQDRPPELQKFPCSLSPNPGAQQGPPPISPKPPTPHNEYTKLPLDKFIDYLELLPVRKAAKLKLRVRNSLEINCDDLGDLGPQCPLSPVTPRTPKSLISQLSREDSNVSSRKRLSYSMSVDRDSITIESESESSDSDSEEAEESVSAKPKELNLMNIDITSLLGQRVRKHVHVESPVQVLKDSESFCKTPVKNTFLDKLRKKPPSYPIMYKPRRLANLSKQNHSYKFTKAERKEFCDYIDTGLKKESRELLRKMKKLRVVLPKLTRKKMLRWVPKKVLNRQLKGKNLVKRRSEIESDIFATVMSNFYPQGPMLLSKNVDRILGLKKKSASRVSDRLKSPLSVSNYISEEMEAELSKQKLTLYRSLLYEVQEYKSGEISDLVKPMEKGSKEHQLQTVETISAKKDYIPIADRVFVEEAEEKPKGMSVLRALLRKNKEAVAKPPFDRKSTIMDSSSNTRTPALDRLSNPLRSDLVKGFNLKKSSSDSGSNASSCMSSPRSTKSCDDSDTSPKVPLTKSGCKTPVIDDTVSIISVSSDGESPILNCCAGCNKKIESNKSTIVLPTDKDISKFTEPLTVNVDTEFDKLTKIKPDLRVDLTYGVPSPVPSTSESPLPLTPLRKGIKPKEPVENLTEEGGDEVKRVTRSNRSAVLASFDDLDRVIKTTENSPKRENKGIKLQNENIECVKKSPNKDNTLSVKKIDTPKSSPKKESKLATASSGKTETPRPRKKEVHAEGEEHLKAVTGPLKLESKLAKSLDGTYEILTKSSGKDIKQEESPLKTVLRSSTLSEKVPLVKPLKKTQSLTPSPSPKKAEIRDLKRSVTDSPKSFVSKAGEKVDIKRSLGSGDGHGHSPKKDSSEKTVIQLRSSTLLTPTKMTIRTRSVSVDSNGKVDDNQYSLRSGNFVIDSPRRNGDSSWKNGAELVDKGSPKTNHCSKKDSKMSLEIRAKADQNMNRSPKKSASATTQVTRKIDFSVNPHSNAVESPSRRPKRKLSAPVGEFKPAKLRKVSSDVAVKN